LLFRHGAVEHSHANTVADDFTAALLAVPHQIGIVLGGQCVHGHGGPDAVFLQHVQDAEDPDAVPVFAVCQQRVIRVGPGRHAAGLDRAKAVGGGLPFQVLQVDHHAQRHARLIGPSQGRRA
jgi:hypothetical protein